MHVTTMINGKKAQVLIDTRAFQNFIKVDKVKRLGLSVEISDGWLKIVNSMAKLLSGVVRDVELHLDIWRGKINFFVVTLNDFAIVLGI